MSDLMKQRPRPLRNAPERETLTSFLDFLRATAVAKVAGLTDEQARSTPLRSTMTPLGLIKHMTATERWWFSIDFAALDVPQPWPEGEPFDGFELTDDDTIDGAVAAYETECAASREVVANSDLDDPAHGPGMDFNLRHALVHLIEETARHCGHLDLMREAIDGDRGY
jgi:hypothetical protein